ncbi:hypothetical protein GCM10007907_36860 [Chitinimonas prasina]|uniref:Guanylate cyclase domain-containing protein n=1 Tax=Chitinimonas prasina TaxID=1434937 RepID=A0ABQ5YNI7_9NEIS|nr:adenylate/guanylate cyclase domain-containing protein [Chitinimonas prasina]GLR14896.1 hypothetical protein GCM10007907_36860 [Chitinimonas prasina]
MSDRLNKTLICSVVFLDIVEYSRQPVSTQMRLKEAFNSLLSKALQDIAVSDRIIIDTGDGAAISFLGDPEDALFVAISLRDAVLHNNDPNFPRFAIRIGINLGPAKLVKDINGQLNLLGDGINASQRVMSFAEPGCILVSRSYYEVVSCLSDEYAQLFQYEGSRTDKHVREHEVYQVGFGELAKRAVRPGGIRRAKPGSPAHNKRMLNLRQGGIAALLVVALIAGSWWFMQRQDAPPQLALPAAAPAVAQTEAAPVAAPAAADPAKRQAIATKPAATSAPPATPAPTSTPAATQTSTPTPAPALPPATAITPPAEAGKATPKAHEKPTVKPTPAVKPAVSKPKRQAETDIPSQPAPRPREKVKPCPVAECTPDGRPKRDR